MKVPLRILAALLCLVLASGCEVDQPTQIILVVDTDLQVPLELDRIKIRIEHMGVTAYNLDYHLNPNTSGSTKLPGTLAIKTRKDPNHPVTITVTGFLDATEKVIRRARLPFAPEREVMLRMNLLRACLKEKVKCQAAETCTELGCKKIDIDPASLPDWDEGAANKGLDASPPPPDMGPSPDMGPDSAPPDGPTPDIKAPDMRLPDMASPDAQAPDANVIDASPLDTQITIGDAPRPNE